MLGMNQVRLEFVEGSSNKFWELALDGAQYQVRWGRIGTKGQEKAFSCANPGKAKTESDKLIAEKRKKGYVDVKGSAAAGGKTKAAPAPKLARDPSLEKVIAGSPDDPAGYLVYADWLQAQGDPRGELVSLQHSLSEKADPALAKREKQILSSNGSFIGGIEKELATVTWRWGFIDSVRIFNKKDWMDNSFDVMPITRQIFGSPAAAFVRELKLGVIRWEMNDKDVAQILGEVAKLGAADKIRVLRLGDVHDIDIDLAHHPLGKLDVLSKSFKNLEVLTLYGHEFSFASLELPKLRELAIKTCGLSKKNMAAIANHKWPKLESLELWFGAEDYGAQCKPKDLAAIFDGSAIPKVKKLGLKNAEFTNAICEELARGKVMKQLEELDLSMGTMDDKGAQALAANPKAFAHLKRLDVSDNFLSKKAIADLKKIGCPIVAKDQKDIEEGDEDFRYVTAGE
jgi:uncharacterized protein (TIGR02996 family)